MTYQCTKTYHHNVGLSCAFRQWHAESHCRFIHGYALAFKFTFEADALDGTNWVVDFGNMKGLKQSLEWWFDHTLVVAKDDPLVDTLLALHNKAAQVRLMLKVGCEEFANHAFILADAWLADNHYTPRVRLLSVECREHEGNSAIYTQEEVIRASRSRPKEERARRRDREETPSYGSVRPYH